MGFIQQSKSGRQIRRSNVFVRFWLPSIWINWRQLLNPWWWTRNAVGPGLPFSMQKWKRWPTQIHRPQRPSLLPSLFPQWLLDRRHQLKKNRWMWWKRRRKKQHAHQFLHSPQDLVDWRNSAKMFVKRNPAKWNLQSRSLTSSWALSRGTTKSHGSEFLEIVVHSTQIFN